MKWLLTLAFYLGTHFAKAQSPGWIFFTDKGDSIEKYHDPLAAPVFKAYIEYLEKDGLEVLGTSKWFNAAFVRNLPDNLTTYDFVNAWRPSSKIVPVLSSLQSNDLPYGLSRTQIEMLRLDSIHRMGYQGSAVRIGIFDAGFYGVDRYPVFESLRRNGQIKAAYDFVEEDSTYTSSGHGTAVLGLVGVWHPDTLVGAAPAADFILARTEDIRSETRQEELNWVNAMEWADDLGVDIIHSSIGYTVFDRGEGDYSYEDMDGQSTMITIAANVATGRGIFVTNSAGNYGQSKWKYIVAPCDGFDVLCVGAVNQRREHVPLSSYGPSADGRIKPEVMAMGSGNFLINTIGKISTGMGTSFSGPLIAGMVACLKQAHPSIGNYMLRDAIIRSADRYHSPDSAYGYGIPDAVKADSIIRFQVLNSLEVEADHWKIYPNPVKSSVNIKGNTHRVNYKIYKMDGILVQEGQLFKNDSFNLDERLKNGTYLLVLSNGLYHKSHLMVVLR